MATRLKLINVEGPLPPLMDLGLSPELQRATAHAAWGAFNYET